MSTAYYALFHCLAKSSADLLVGGENANRSRHAWKQVYRGLQHTTAKNNCKDQNLVRRFPLDIQDFPDLFIVMQEKRHRADYHPHATFSKSEALEDIAQCETAIRRYSDVDVKDRRAFVAYVLFKRRVD